MIQHGPNGNGAASPLMQGAGKPTREEVRMALGPFAVMLSDLQERLIAVEAELAFYRRQAEGAS